MPANQARRPINPGAPHQVAPQPTTPRPAASLTSQYARPLGPRNRDERPVDEDISRQLAEFDKRQAPEDKSKTSGTKAQKKAEKAQKKFEKCNKKRIRKGKRPLTMKQWKSRRLFKRVLLVILLVVLLIGGFYAYKILHNVGKAFGGNLFGLIAKERLKQDANGFTNILIFGTSPDGWDGADLADSIMVLSYNQDTNKAYTISLPRDLYVKHACTSYLGTSAGKLNESYVCGKKDAEAIGQNETAAETAGQKELAQAAQKVLGLEVHYQVHANWRVLVGVVDSVGGIDVKVEAYDGSPVVYDVATKIRYKNGEVAHMNGEQALAFSRARGSHGGTGLSGGNFDRERNQQKVLKATAEKIKTSNKADLNAMTGIMDALGNNIRTSFEAKELQTLVDIAGKFENDKMVSIPLVDTENNKSYFRTGNIGGASVVVPVGGTFEYSKIQAYVKEKMTEPTSGKKVEEKPETAKLVVLNGSGKAGLAAQHQASLTAKGLTVAQVGNFSGARQSSTIIYDLTGKNPKTLATLKGMYGNNVSTSPPASVSQYGSDFVIVLGVNQ